MKYYSRIIYKREPINRYGKLGFVEYVEFVKTNSIDRFNYRKQIKFTETINAKQLLLHGHEADHVYSMKLEEYNELIRKMVSQ